MNKQSISILLFCLLGLILVVSCGIFSTNQKKLPVVTQETRQFANYGHQKTLNVCVDDGFSNEHKREIFSAIEEWERYLRDIVELRIKEIDIMTVALGPASGCDKWVLLGKESFGWVQNQNIDDRGMTHNICGRYVYVLIDRVSVGEVKTIVMHELGHAFCLKHTEGGLMRAKLNNDALINIDDAVWAAYFLGTNL